MRRLWPLVLVLSACSPLEAPTPLTPVEYQWGAEPRDDAWQVTPDDGFAKAGDTLWFRVAVPSAGSIADPAVQYNALFSDDAWVCGHHFERVSQLPIVAVPCAPTQLVLRARPDQRLSAPTFLFGSEHALFTRLLRAGLATFVVGATMALVGLLFLATGLRRGAERAYRGLGLFLSSLGVLVLLNTQLRHLLPFSGSTVFTVHEVMTSLYPFGFVDFLLGTLGDGPRRVLRRGLAVFAGYVVLEWTLHLAGVLHLATGREPTAVFIVVFIAQGLVLAAKARRTNPSARIFLVGLAALFLISVPDILDGAGFKVLPFQTVPYAVLSFGVAMVVMIERQHRAARDEAQQAAKELAVKLAALEERNREINSLNTELRHQIAERSREMADALQGGIAEVRAARALQAGDVVDGRYRVVRVLGRGAMGAVHAVERLSDGRQLALKMMTGSVDAHLAARFAREAEIAARVADEHLVKVFDVGGAGSGELYLVMEFIDGKALEDHRSRFGDVPWALALLRQIASGVRALHAAGVVHRDLKPANVLLATGPDGQVLAKISDFGISRRGGSVEVDATSSPLLATLPDPGSTHAPAATEPDVGSTLIRSTTEPVAVRSLAPALTAVGSLLGTPAYMAPELARGAQHASPASDLFALGLIAWELLTGRTPFAEPPVFIALAGRHLTAAPPLPAEVPDAIATLVTRCLAEQPGQRPTADEFAAAI
ncbi:MAG: serine/threonine-protein kinase [Myxococcaceae bacterium]